jgi:transposase
MAQVAQQFKYIIGVDTHAATHAYAVLASTTGAVVGQAQFPASPAGVKRAADWIARRAPEDRLIAVEGTGSYGASLTRELHRRGERVCEAKPPKRQQRTVHGKSDPADAIEAARSALAADESTLITPRAEGLRSALRVLLVARRAIDTRRTADRNALNALIRTFGLGIDARKALSDTRLQQIAGWRAHATDDSATSTIRNEARRLARTVITATDELVLNWAALERHVREVMPGLLDIRGVGPVVAAMILAAWSHGGRVRSEAAFATLAGVAPLEASSGKTIRHRLSRSGDRQLNCALDIIAKVRMAVDPDTRSYVARRTAEGRTPREIRRCLKRYIARQLFRQMTALTT